MLTRQQFMENVHIRYLQSGSTLIEVLVTMLIVSFALLGVAGMQLTSVRTQQTAHLRDAAVNQVQMLAERIRSNSSVLGGAGVTAYLAANDYANASTIPADPACSANAGTCTSAEAAQLDVREWRQNLARELPGGRGSIFSVATTAVPPVTATQARTIIVMWLEKAEGSDDNLGAPPTDATCPTPRVAGVRCLSVVVTP